MLPRGELDATFERYWDEFRARRDGKDAPGTPTRRTSRGPSGRSCAWAGGSARRSSLDFFFADRRPAGWNQWAEVVGREPRAPRFIGDMPHAWVGSDFIRSVLDLFAYERAEDGALVLAAGIPAGWLRGGPGVAVRAPPDPARAPRLHAANGEGAGCASP